MDDRDRLELAKAEARQGRSEGGIPIGAALVADDGTVLGTGRNRRVQMGSAIRHGETDALEHAGRLPAEVYARSTMYTTLSPCSMCTGAILLYGIPRVVIGEHHTFMGEEDLLRFARCRGDHPRRRGVRGDDGGLHRRRADAVERGHRRTRRLIET